MGTPDRDALLRETYRLNHELGYIGFRDQYFNDPDLIKEWPDPAVREREVRNFWDEREGSFASYYKDFANDNVKVLTAYRDYLHGLLAGDKDGQVDYYNRVSDMGRRRRIHEEGLSEVKSASQPLLSPAAIADNRDEMLLDLGTRLDAGKRDEPLPDRKDAVTVALARIHGVEQFEGMLERRKRDEHLPWRELSEADKVIVMMGIAAEAGPPGAYTLAAIEREVDYGKLPAWRREALEWVRSQIDGGELDGEIPDSSYPGDRADLALFVELEARIEDPEHFSPARTRHAGDQAGRQPPPATPGEIATGDDLDASGRDLDEVKSANQRLLSPAAIADVRDDIPAPEEWRKLKAEWKHDYGLRHLEDRGVRYEDEVERQPDQAAARGKSDGQFGEQQGKRLPSPGEIARDNHTAAPEKGNGQDQARDEKRGRVR
jgi:hypothetical protein